MNMDLLISEVKRRPALWDKSHKFYRHRVYTDKSWEAISKITGISSKLAKDKWKNLRDHFKREIFKLPPEVHRDPNGLIRAYSGKWKYFPTLMFLLGFISHSELPKPKGQETDDNFTENDDINNVDIEFDNENVYDDEGNSWCSSTAATIPNVVSQEASSVPKRKKHVSVNDNIIDDSDLLFLQSLLPFFKELTPIRKLHVRREFENVLMQELKVVEVNTAEVTETVVKLEHHAEFD